MRVEGFLEESAKRLPDKTALVCGGRRLTYRELDGAAGRLARTLLADGFRRGDRAAVYMDNSPESVIATFAILKAGGVFLQINPTAKPDKVAELMNDCRAAALVTHRSKLDPLSAVWERLSHLRRTYVTGLEPGPRPAEAGGPVRRSWEEALADAPEGALPAFRGIDRDLAALIYTSGSTGRAKGVMLTHLNIVSATVSICTYLENTEDDVLLGVLPLSFGYGLTQVFTGFRVGATLVLERSFAYPHVVMQSLVRERATGFALVPTVSAMLLQMNLEEYDLSSLRYITNAAAAFPLEHIRQLRRRLPRVKLFPMHGLTECLRVTYLPPDQVDVRPSSVGRGMPNEEVYILDEQGRRAAPGVVGELVVRGSHVMSGYWEDPEATDRVLRPGPLPGEKVLYTGDLFKTDEEGYLYFVSRKDDIIKTRGEKVSPKEVEDVLYAVDGVAEAAVVGAPDPVLGQHVLAVVSLRDGASVTEQDILFHCKQKLEDFMIPKRVVIRREPLPKTSSGKILKRELAS